MAIAREVVSLQNRFVVLATYRQLLRATRIAFQGDYDTLTNARRFARQNFDQNKTVRVGSIEAANGIEHAQSVTKILRENVVQGSKSGAEEKFKLRIHEETERGDNETIRKLKGTGKSFKDLMQKS
ncbi:Mitochondrial zinc maintenance protein 1, mitochondrial [Taxawa tesnikishii (nom. ined.)]|nr:Mitochondrial zinc maintenance protein 1, mitochondrial [Dothideales sp. JES 119]